MNAYFDIILQLTWMMIFISIVTLPAMYIFSSYSALSTSATYMFDQFSLGNMGGSSITCGQVPLAVPGAVLSLSCTTGTIQTTATTSDGSLAFQSGIIPSNALQSNYCSAAAVQVAEGSDSISLCSSLFNADAVMDHVAANCDGLQTCSISFNSASSGYNSEFFNYSASYPSICY
jgi:hypothetical protein